MKPKTLSLVQLNLAVLLWGGTAMFAKGIALPIGHIICLRSFVAAALLLAFLLWCKEPVKLKRPGHYAIFAVIGALLGLHWLTYFGALRASTAAVAILSLHTYPVFTALVEPFVFGEKLKKIDIVLVLVVFAGVLVMTPEISLSNTTTRGILLGVVSGLLFMARNLMTRKYVKEYTSSTLMFWQTLVSGIILVPALFLSGEADYSPSAIGLLVLLGILFTAVPQTLFSASFKTLSAKTAGVLGTLLIFYGALLGYLIHDEQVTPRTALGGLIILACIIFETVRTVRQPGATLDKTRL
jgi:drug/metabolite transporter (DMT)-like permease